MGNWQVILLEPAKTVLDQIGRFIVSLLLVLIILLIGWIISRLIQALVTKLLRTIKLDNLSESIELDDMLAKGGIKYSVSELIGVICYWLALLVTFVVAINAVGLTIAADLLNRLILYIPNIIAAIFILMLGMFAATILRNIVQTAARNAGVEQANLLSKVAEILVIAFAVFVTLEQLKIGIRITEITLGIALGSIGLGLALAFGLGCKEIVGKMMADMIEKLKKK